MKTLFSAVLVAGVLAGCASSSQILSGKTRPAIQADAVKIYTKAPENSEEIAWITGTASVLGVASVDQDAALDSMKRRAAKLGANGLLVTDTTADVWSGATVKGRAIYVPLSGAEAAAQREATGQTTSAAPLRPKSAKE